MIENTEKITLYIGMNDKDTKTQRISTQDGLRIVEGIMYALTDGATVSIAGKGVYKYEDGAKVTEETLQAVCYGLPRDRLQGICEVIKKALNQETICVEFSTVPVAFM